ncbi:alpha/beta hydrolase fold domain-containing protein [Nocardioides sp. QY071]|uniref:alpha/beta hydrolase fold domain-containing protein n=1 Tax=Nocardioides sp. QY071 TaxID=3044187 RepID=UPI002499AF0D|nr:alpha/beta hydrolase fold domain-containing protein [Nocardioides sp. QY071]WGY00877.1 alpha/beta hydrolase fold domain-containing protein [Nocardioides sp. QY071]
MQVPLRAARLLTRHVVRPVLGTRLAPARQRQVIDTLMRFPLLPTGTTTVRTTLGGVPADRIETAASNPDHALLYLHGGAYVVGSPTTHRAAAAHLADATGAVAHVLDYRLAPEHPYPAAVDDALAAYCALLERGLPSERVVVAGDSAGGGLALALALRARSVGVPLPAALGLISPWVDARLDGLAEHIDDPLLTRDWLELGARSYAGRHREHPEVSPLLADPADLAALPALFVQAASDELFVDDVERFVAAARAAGAEVTYHRLEGHWHVTHLYAGMVREATEVVRELGGWLRSALP